MHHANEHKKWTADEFAYLRKSAGSLDAQSKRLGRSRKAIEVMRRNLGLPVPTKCPVNQTLCWRCDHAARGCSSQCSWVREFKPVKGWDAIETELKHCSRKGETVRSYCVFGCPLYVKDARG